MSKIFIHHMMVALYRTEQSVLNKLNYKQREYDNTYQLLNGKVLQ